MIKVLQIGLTNNKGGIESFVLNYFEKMSSHDIQFDFIKSFDSLEYEIEFRERGSQIFNVSNFNHNPIKYFIQIYKIIKDNGYEIIHYNMNSCVNILPLIAGTLANCKIIIAHAHNSSNDKGIIKEFLHRINRPFLKCFANRYLSCSNEASKWFFKNIDPKDISLIRNSIDYKKYMFNNKIREDYRKQFNIEKSFVIGHVGRFNKQKNHGFIIKIFEKIVEKEKNVKLILVGDGPEYERINQLINSKNLEDKILILKNRNDVCCLYQMFDTFILPSLYEGLPLVGIEAQVSGLPCFFSSNVTKEVALNHESKFIPLNDQEKWVKELLNSKGGKRIILNDYSYSIDNNVYSLVSLYKNFQKTGEKVIK